MASRILFEEELADQSLQSFEEETDKSVTVKEEIIANEGNTNQTDQEPYNTINNNDHCIQPLENAMSYQNHDINDDISKGNRDTDNLDRVGKDTNNEGNIDQIDNSNVPNSYEIPILEGNSCQSPVDVLDKDKNTKVKKKPSELELLGVDVKVKFNDVDSKYDVFGDENQVYRKYKLRKSEPISYKEPTDWKPERHTNTDTQPKSLTCTVCYTNFASTRALQIHLRKHETVAEYICSLCLEKFKSNADLIAHKSTHNSESFLCNTCKVAFSDHCDYLLHKLTHATKTQFKCPECGLQYNKSSYKLHIVTHFDKQVNCPICSCVCKGEFNLQNHLNGHKYKITCVECGKICKSKKHYEYHMSVHTGVKKYQCLYCGKGFRNPGQRTIHTRLHTGEKPYTCDICGHKCTQSNDLKRHMVTHESEKKYTCEHCSKKFYHKDYFMNHLRSHTKKSLYPCPECDGEFVSPAGLKVHLLYKHLPDRPVECAVCEKKFINVNQFQKHSKSKYHKRNMYGLMMKQGS